VRVLSAQDGTELLKLTEHQDWVGRVTWSVDGCSSAAPTIVRADCGTSPRAAVHSAARQRELRGGCGMITGRDEDRHRFR
jgi:hypothetical protein